MEIEEILRIEILDNSEMYLVLSSGGKSFYQYIYREAAEVYWEHDLKAFKSPAPRKWSHADWFDHIKSVAASGLGIDLHLTKTTQWINVPLKTKNDICNKTNT